MDSFSNNVLDGMPFQQAGFIRASEARFTIATSQNVIYVILNTEGQHNRNTEKRLCDAAGKICNKLIVRDLEVSKGAYCCLGTPKDRLAINKIARPLHQRFQEVISGCPDLDDVAINLASLHAGIWTPPKALGSPAKGILEKAEAAYIKNVLKPLADMVERSR